MSASGHTSSRDRVFCGAIALLVVMLLRCGIGAFGLISDVRDLNQNYSDLAILAEEDPSEDKSAAKHIGGDGLGDLDAYVGPSTVVVDALRPTTPCEDQVAFILRNGGIQCAVRPTGPPRTRA
jgi:hypothetical protein